ncbi:hypothetical protein Bbelb_400280 [Branchiostoma belcheri]|nr:hypothetical protein Bbelb_400280 [Branchiostoma belcheri]
MLNKPTLLNRGRLYFVPPAAADLLRTLATGRVSLIMAFNSNGFTRREGTMTRSWVPAILVMVAVAVVQSTHACPDECQCFKDVPSVHCNAPGLDHIPQGIPENTTLLQMQGTKLAIVRKGDLKGLPLLRSLYLFGNRLQTIKVGVFDDTPALVDLEAGGNQISELSAGVFRGLDKLQEVHLSLNNIVDIPAGVFSSRPNLQVVDLQKNRIMSIQPGAFANMPNSDVFELSDNNIGDIKDGVFQGPQGAIHLMLGNNNISVIEPTALRAFKNLTLLSLDNNNILELDLSGIKCFSETGFIKPGVFAGLGRVTLGTLSLTNNRLRQVPTDAIEQVGNITVLNLSGNNISAVGLKDFGHHTYFFTLDLSDNKLTSLPEEALMTLDIFMLELSGNPLVYIGPDAFKQGLFHVGLENTKLRIIDESAFNRSQGIKSLTLNNNSLHYLPELIFAPLTFYGDPQETLLLDDNPWRCDCQMRDYAKWLHSSASVKNLSHILNS